MEPLFRRTFDCASLVEKYPARWGHANKRQVFEIACPPGTIHSGDLTFSRWAAMPLPEKLPATTTTVDGRPDFFAYEPVPAGQLDWHLNFAHNDLFAFYRGPLLAQDEMQVAEHPILGSLRELLVFERINPLTVEDGKPTPILIRGAQRRASIATDRNAAKGRPHGLYGNAFAKASSDTIRRAVTRIDPPTITNIIAIEAPAYGSGAYTREELQFILQTAYSGFRAAVIESATSASHRITIHTGFWGCGAYGGNRILMTTLQLLAARLAQVDQVVYHTGDKEGLSQYQDAQQAVDALLKSTSDTDKLIEQLVARKFRWGASDGN